MRVEELNPEKFYAIIIQSPFRAVEELKHVRKKFKERGLEHVVLIADSDSQSISPPRYWGIYDNSRKRWLVKSNGEPFHYPSPAVAQALLNNHLADNVNVVDGRGRSLSEALAVREMTTTNNDGPSRPPKSDRPNSAS